MKLLTPDRVYLAVFAQVLEDAVRLELDPHGVGAEGPADVWCSRHGLAPAGSHQPRGVRRTSRLPTVTALVDIARAGGTLGARGRRAITQLLVRVGTADEAAVRKAWAGR